MPCLHTVIAKVARSEMSRNALNNWDKFKLPPNNARIDTLVEKLRQPDGGKNRRRRAI